MKLVFSFLVIIAITAIDTFGTIAVRDARKLFRLMTAPAIASVADRSSIASKREAEIVFDQAAMDSVSSLDTIEVPLFDGRSYRAERRSVEFRTLGDTTWRGKIISGEFSGDVVITFRKGFVAGLVYSPNGVYEIVPRGDKHFLVELDQAAFPECGGDVKGEPPTAIDTPSAIIDSGDRIDVLVVYTTATKNLLGGDAQAQTHAQQAIDATNTVYINSRIRQRVRLVNAQEYFYTETASASTDLSNLRSNATVQALRNSHTADLVAMIGEMQGVCGIGYLMGATGGNQNNGFTATARSCAVGNLSFAHELGHNMGSQHNPENGSNPTFPYGFGHYVNGSYRTVMSYVNPCTSGCTRVAYFSNPNVIFNGVPTGIENARDNARSINNTADWIANYRYSGSNVMLEVLNAGELVQRIANRTVTWSSDNMTGNVRIDLSRDEATTWETLVASTPNDGAESIRIAGKPTRRARLRIVSLENAAVTDSSLVSFTIR